MAQLSLCKSVKKQHVGLSDRTNTTELSEAAATACAYWEVDGIHVLNVTVNDNAHTAKVPWYQVSGENAKLKGR